MWAVKHLVTLHFYVRLLIWGWLDLPWVMKQSRSSFAKSSSSSDQLLMFVALKLVTLRPHLLAISAPAFLVVCSFYTSIFKSPFTAHNRKRIWSILTGSHTRNRHWFHSLKVCQGSLVNLTSRTLRSIFLTNAFFSLYWIFRQILCAYSFIYVQKIDGSFNIANIHTMCGCCMRFLDIIVDWQKVYTCKSR